MKNVKFNVSFLLNALDELSYYDGSLPTGLAVTDWPVQHKKMLSGIANLDRVTFRFTLPHSLLVFS